MRTAMLVLALLTACSSQAPLRHAGSGATTLPPVYLRDFERVRVRHDDTRRLHCLAGTLLVCECKSMLGTCVCSC